MRSRRNTPGILQRSVGWASLRLALLTLFGALSSGATEQDTQFWFPVQVVHPFGENWTVSMQAEIRLEDDMSEFSELVLKPAANYHFDEHWVLSLGYKFIDKGDDANENDLWQEVHYNWTHNEWSGGHQVRLEQRSINGNNGIIPRLRWLSHVAHPLPDTCWYVTGWGAVRFNLGSQTNAAGEGPVDGFEQSRVFVGLGRNFGGHTKFEFGYLYRYERERTSADKSDHALHLQLVYHPGGGLLKRPTAKDHYR